MGYTSGNSMKMKWKILLFLSGISATVFFSLEAQASESSTEKSKQPAALRKLMPVPAVWLQNVDPTRTNPFCAKNFPENKNLDIKALKMAPLQSLWVITKNASPGRGLDLQMLKNHKHPLNGHAELSTTWNLPFLQEENLFGSKHPSQTRHSFEPFPSFEISPTLQTPPQHTSKHRHEIEMAPSDNSKTKIYRKLLWVCYRISAKPSNPHLLGIPHPFLSSGIPYFGTFPIHRFPPRYTPSQRHLIKMSQSDNPNVEVYRKLLWDYHRISVKSLNLQSCGVQ